jgi:hypothetical protein
VKSEGGNGLLVSQSGGSLATPAPSRSETRSGASPADRSVVPDLAMPPAARPASATQNISIAPTAPVSWVRNGLPVILCAGRSQRIGTLSKVESRAVV